MAGRAMVGTALLGLASFCGQAGQAQAQDTPRLSVVDCAQSRIAAPAGLECEATQNMSGGALDAEGTSRSWLAFGNLNGVELFYTLSEATSPRVGMQENFSLQKDMRLFMQNANLLRDFSPLGNRGGADFMTFTSPAGNACIGIRRYGPSQDVGYRWILHGLRCEPSGKVVTDAEIDGFIASARYRES